MSNSENLLNIATWMLDLHSTEITEEQLSVLSQAQADLMKSSEYRAGLKEEIIRFFELVDDQVGLCFEEQFVGFEEGNILPKANHYTLNFFELAKDRLTEKYESDKK